MPAKLKLTLQPTFVPDTGSTREAPWPQFVLNLIDQSINFPRQTIGATPEPLELGEISPAGWVVGRNLGPYPVYFVNSDGIGLPFAPPGAPFLFCCASPPYAVSPQGNSDIEFIATGRPA